MLEGMMKGRKEWKELGRKEGQYKHPLLWCIEITQILLTGKSITGQDAILACRGGRNKSWLKQMSRAKGTERLLPPLSDAGPFITLLLHSENSILRRRKSRSKKKEGVKWNLDFSKDSDTVSQHSPSETHHTRLGKHTLHWIKTWPLAGPKDC